MIRSIPRTLAVLFAALYSLPSARADMTLTGGITLVKEGGSGHPVAVNIALGKTAFAQDEIGVAPHAVADVNDGVTGNSSSWIAGTQNSFVGINLGATAVAVRCVAFGRDDTGSFTDRTYGLYEIEYTTTPNPTAATTTWTSIGTMNYRTIGGANYALPSRRHVFNLPVTVMATGIRLKVNATSAFDLTCVDELELYAQPFHEGFTLLEQGGTFRTNNLAAGRTPFVKDSAGVAPHAPGKLNNGLYGNGESWLAGSANTFAGVSLGATPVTINKVAFSRDNTGAANDRWPGTYLFQVTTVANPDASTPDASWTTVGEVNYSVMPLTGSFSAPHRRHLWSFGDVPATGFRLKITTPAGGANLVCVDELEIYDSTGVEQSPPVITPPANVFASAPGLGMPGAVVTYPPATVVDDTDPAPVVTYSMPSGSTFPVGVTTVTITATDALGNTGAATFTVTVRPAAPEAQGGIFLTNNLAAGKTAFAKDEIAVLPHAIRNVNDGSYGNSYSWIAGSTDSFVGINLGSTPVSISKVAWGRDNTGAAGDRCIGIYTLQYTTVPNPGAATPDASWSTIATIDFSMLAGTGTFTAPWLRHVWSFPAVSATGFRLKVQAPGGAGSSIAIDELELYDSSATVPAGVSFIAGGVVYSTGGALFAFGSNVGSADVKRLYVSNGGGTALTSVALGVTGGDAASFTLDAGAVPATLAAGSFATFTVSNTATSLGQVRATTLRLTGTGIADFDLNLQATGVDTEPPVITTPASLTTADPTLGQTQVAVTYPPATAVDNADPAPTITYSRPSGSLFPVATTTVVNVFATDAAGNTSRAEFTVTVPFAIQLIEQGGSFWTNNLAVGKPVSGYLSGDLFPATRLARAVNGLYGVGQSTSSYNEFAIAVAFSQTPVTIDKVAWGAHNFANGGEFELPLASYTLQYSPVPNLPGYNTPEWITIKTVDYTTLPQTGLFSEPFRRHVWAFSPVQAASFRLLVNGPPFSAGGTSVDELEIYGPDARETQPPLLGQLPNIAATSPDGAPVIVTYDPATATDNIAPPPVITYSHPSGTAFPVGVTQVTVTATDAAGNTASNSFLVAVASGGNTTQLVAQGFGFLGNNLAAGKTAFAKNHVGIAPHAISNVNDGTYGNDNSWIPATADSFVGINLGSTPVNVSRIAFGRDNTGAAGDRWSAWYQIEYTTVPDPGASTPDASWNTISLLNYAALPQTGNFTAPALRHLWAFPAVNATGIRLRIISPDGFDNLVAIDEIELYGPAGTPYLQWQAQHFGSNTANTGSHEDYDHDGISNLIEFASGTLPASGSLSNLSYTGSTITPGLPVISGDTAWFIRRKDRAASGLTYHPEISTDLSAWTEITTGLTIAADDGTHEVVCVPLPSGADRGLFRVRTQAAP